MKCEDKQQYPSKTRAEQIRRKRERENRTLQLRSYRCPDCGYWHLTHVPDRFSEEESA